MDRGARVPLDDQVRNALMGKEKRHGQAHQAATDDQDGNLVMLHASGTYSTRSSPNGIGRCAQHDARSGKAAAGAAC